MRTLSSAMLVMHVRYTSWIL
ncbi:hypothetical protein OF001_U530003 [Pseudomonas sp. OF001]|nr:hypothetical protein OF001_U530003 [Pseudomonas sp. OF001]